MMKITDVDLRQMIVATEELSHCEKAFHLEVLVLDARVRSSQVDITPHLVGALLWYRKEGRPQAVCSLRRETSDQLDVQIML